MKPEQIVPQLEQCLERMLGELGRPAPGLGPVSVLRLSCASSIALGSIRAAVEQFEREPHDGERALLSLIGHITRWVAKFRDDVGYAMTVDRPEILAEVAQSLGFDITGKTPEELLDLLRRYHLASSRAHANAVTGTKGNVSS